MLTPLAVALISLALIAFGVHLLRSTKQKRKTSLVIIRRRTPHISEAEVVETPKKTSASAIIELGDKFKKWKNE